MKGLLSRLIRSRSEALVILGVLCGALGALAAWEGASAATEVGARSTKRHRLWDGLVSVDLPRTAAAPQRASRRSFSVQPKTSKYRFIIFVTREPLLRDEVKKTNAQLVSWVKKTLEAQGYQVISITNKGNDFEANFRVFTKVPWQKVGTMYTRGSAKFTRSKTNELVGSILLCDPKQWQNSATQSFKDAVASTKVSS